MLPIQALSHYTSSTVPCGRKYSQMLRMWEVVCVETESIRPYEKQCRKKSQMFSCAKSFKSNMCLSYHIKSHVKGNLLKCSECAKSFKSNMCLSYHIKSHVKGNLLKCSECAKSFKSKQGLSIHIKAHAAKALQEKFRCTSCVKLFTSRFRLAEHQCHACLSCENVFCSQKMLENHLWRQHYTTMLPCSECEKRFQRYTTLNSHMRRHRIEQKYFKLSPTNDSSSTRNDQI
eukprot:144763_1